MSELTADGLRELLSYCPSTGVFRWIVKPSWGVSAGDVAGYLDEKGYWNIRVRSKGYRAHRLAWLYVHGRWPADQIDHINGVRDDNRIANLREATGAQNQQNRRVAGRNNKSCGLLGVTRCKGGKPWQANIKVSGRQRKIGTFKTAEEAHAAYLRAKAELHPFQTIASAA